MNCVSDNVGDKATVPNALPAKIKNRRQSMRIAAKENSQQGIQIHSQGLRFFYFINEHSFCCSQMDVFLLDFSFLYSISRILFVIFQLCGVQRIYIVA